MQLYATQISPFFHINLVSNIKISSLFLTHVSKAVKAFRRESSHRALDFMRAFCGCCFGKGERGHIKRQFWITSARRMYAKRRRRLHPFSRDTFIQAIILSAAIYNEREIMWARARERTENRLWWRSGELSRIIILCQDWLQLLFGKSPAGRGCIHRLPTELCNCFGTSVARACLPSPALSTAGARSAGEMDK